MFGSAEAGELFRPLRARSVPGRWHLLRCWHTVRRISGQRQGFPGTRLRLIWGCTVRQKGGAADGLPAPRGKEHAGKMAFAPVLADCPADFRAAAGLPQYRVTVCMGLCCPAERRCGGRTSRTPEQECIGKMAFIPVLADCPADFRAAARIPRCMGNTAPKQIPPPHRPGRAAGVFSCTGTGRIRLRHRATWRRWGSRERRLPKPGRQ